MIIEPHEEDLLRGEGGIEIEVEGLRKLLHHLEEAELRWSVEEEAEKQGAYPHDLPEDTENEVLGAVRKILRTNVNNIAADLKKKGE